jgi:hypothetical protein
MLLATVPFVTGCSSSTKELRTNRQAAKFVRAVARGELASKWHLADKATDDAVHAWRNREVIRDLGQRLRSEGDTWACQFAEYSAEVHRIGIFSEADRKAAVRGARLNGASMAHIAPMLHDVTTLSETELVEATPAVCHVSRSA